MPTKLGAENSEASARAGIIAGCPPCTPESITNIPQILSGGGAISGKSDKGGLYSLEDSKAGWGLRSISLTYSSVSRISSTNSLVTLILAMQMYSPIYLSLTRMGESSVIVLSTSSKLDLSGNKRKV